jgi:hypothetical protein
MVVLFAFNDVAVATTANVATVVRFFRRGTGSNETRGRSKLEKGCKAPLDKVSAFIIITRSHYYL